MVILNYIPKKPTIIIRLEITKIFFFFSQTGSPKALVDFNFVM